MSVLDHSPHQRRPAKCQYHCSLISPWSHQDRTSAVPPRNFGKGVNEISSGSNRIYHNSTYSFLPLCWGINDMAINWTCLVYSFICLIRGVYIHTLWNHHHNKFWHVCVCVQVCMDMYVCVSVKPEVSFCSFVLSSSYPYLHHPQLQEVTVLFSITGD